MVDDYVIRVDCLSKRYSLGKNNTQSISMGILGRIGKLFTAGSSAEDSSIWALKDVSFDIKRGERLGFVGKNGAGKSTLLKILSRVVYPSSGEARIRGRVTSLLEVGTGFLNHLTGRQNIYLNASFHGLTTRETDQRFADIVEFSELERFIDTPIKFYSSGMRARLAFSVAAHLDPDILLLDEVLSVGDMAFAKKCLERVEELTQGDRTILFVSHSMDSVRRFCNRCIWLDRGQVVMDGAVDKVTDAFTQDSMTLSSHQRWSSIAPSSSRLNFVSEPVKVANQVSGPGLPDPPHARLVEATVYDAQGRQTSTVCVTDEIKLEVVFEVFFDRANIVPYFRIITDGDLLAFNAVYTNFNSVLNSCKIGKYRASTAIPANLLNSGKYSITVGLCTPSPGKIMRHDEAVKALSIYVHEAPFGVVSSLGPYSKVPGTVRPLLEWSEQEVLNY